MRDFAKLAPTFWTRGSGKKLRGNPEAQVLAMYLVTCPSANMIGVYYVPFVTLAHETGLGELRAREALASLEAAGFAYYDEDAELAWVPNMAGYQIGEEMKPGDKRRSGVLAELSKLGEHRFIDAFYRVYGAAFGLGASPLEGASKGLPDPPLNPLSPSEGQTGDKGREEKRREETERESLRGRGSSAPPVAVVAGNATNDNIGQPTIPGVEVPSQASGPEPDPVAQVYEHWRAAAKARGMRPAKVVGDKDRKRVRDELKRGRTLEDLELAVEGLFLSEHHAKETKWLALEYALRPTNIDGFIAAAAAEREKLASRPQFDEFGQPQRYTEDGLPIVRAPGRERFIPRDGQTIDEHLAEVAAHFAEVSHG